MLHPQILEKKRKTESLYAGVQEEINHKSKQDVLTIMDDWESKVGNKTE